MEIQRRSRILLKVYQNVFVRVCHSKSSKDLRVLKMNLPVEADPWMILRIAIRPALRIVDC